MLLTALAPNRPIASEPQMPPTRCTPTTSSESSKPNLYFKLTASEQRIPAMKPITTAAQGATNAHAGVIATRPETAPDAAPNDVACPLRIFSTKSQPITAPAVAT